MIIIIIIIIITIIIIIIIIIITINVGWWWVARRGEICKLDMWEGKKQKKSGEILILGRNPTFSGLNAIIVKWMWSES